MNIQLAIRALESQQVYEIAIRALTNTLADVDASFKENKIQKAPQVLSPAVNNVSPLEESIYVDGDHNTRVRGIKTKERSVSGSSRPKSALEKATKKKSARKKALHTSSTPATQSVMASTLPIQQVCFIFN